MFSNVLSIVLLILGFGFVVFFHELGHFLAAKWMGIRVEQFAIGIGQALVSWRKGMGLRLGSTVSDYENRIRNHLATTGADTNCSSQQLEQAGRQLGLGETEYRISWMPLGGYVKMLGQDDMNPNSTVDDPRAYNRKSIGARMLVVSAGVIMNVILAGILFMVLFLVGFRSPPAVIGYVLPDSPAQRAGAHPGQKVLTLDGRWQHDFTKLKLNTVLIREGRQVSLTVREPDGTVHDLLVKPDRSQQEAAFLGLGIEPAMELRGWDLKLADLWKQLNPGATPATDIYPGDVVIRVGDKPVQPQDHYVLVQALDQASGQPVEVTVRSADGATRQVQIRPRFLPFYGNTPLNIAGMEPLVQIDSTKPDSSAAGHLKSGDLIVSIESDGSVLHYPTQREFTERIRSAARNDKPVIVGYVRDGKPGKTAPILPATRTEPRMRGLGVAMRYASHEPIVSAVVSGSAAASAGVERGTRIVQVNGQPVSSWFDVYHLLRLTKGDARLTVQAQRLGQSTELTLTLPMDQAQDNLAKIRLAHDQNLQPLLAVRQTSNPLIAAAWGVTETRDFILQFYVTLQRVFQGQVSASNFMGPLGIVTEGSRIATKGTDWLVWFLALISANLAVVNFLPIPIMDGGLFVFLILEKIQGQPPSHRTQTVAQLVGLAIILSIFVFVTYQDIARMFL
jgi:regulator of sigma E protease